jgi:RNA polymerase sigma factor (sigma-70 family)
MAASAVDVRPFDQDTDDLDLVEGVRAGDDRAFEVLYARYQPRIGLYIRGMVQDDGRAEDTTQEVFISALRRMRETDTEIAFKRWIYEIAKNACIDAYRRSRHTNEVSFDVYDVLGTDEHGRLADARATPDIAVDTKLDLDNLRGAFGGLSETHHQILVMRELEGLSYRDIGDRLGMTRPAVESTLFRARRRLEEEYEELVSGKRCLRVRDIIDAGTRAPGLRDQRRMDRHISHCQPCRRHALMAGIDLDARPARPSVAARIAALVPLPALWRRSGADDATGQVFGSSNHATVAHWSANVASTVDPAVVGGWGKAIVAAATVAVASMGAGAAIQNPDAFEHFVSRGPAMVGIGTSSSHEGTQGAAGRQDGTPARARTSRHHVGAGKAGATQKAGGHSSAGGAATSAPAATGTSHSSPGPGHPGAGSISKPGSTGTAGGSGGSAGSGGSGSGGSSAGGSGGGGVLGGQPSTSAAGGAAGVTSAVQGLTSQLGDALSGAVSGSSGALDTSSSTVLGQVQGIAGPITSSVQVLAGM